MSEFSDSQRKLLLLTALMAIVLAAATFLAISFVQSRPEVPEGVARVTVNGVVVAVRPDPAKVVRLVGSDPLATPVPQPEATSDGSQGEPTPEATAVPEALPTTAPPVPTSPPAAVDVIFIPYTVQAGDTLYSIADRMDTSITLMARYGISSENLTPGTVIQLPIGNPAYCPGYRPYAVAEGDTAFSIYRKFGVTPDQLQAINNLDANYTIYSAQILCVP